MQFPGEVVLGSANSVCVVTDGFAIDVYGNKEFGPLRFQTFSNLLADLGVAFLSLQFFFNVKDRALMKHPEPGRLAIVALLSAVTGMAAEGMPVVVVRTVELLLESLLNTFLILPEIFILHGESHPERFCCCIIQTDGLVPVVVTNLKFQFAFLSPGQRTKERQKRKPAAKMATGFSVRKRHGKATVGASSLLSLPYCSDLSYLCVPSSFGALWTIEVKKIQAPLLIPDRDEFVLIM